MSIDDSFENPWIVVLEKGLQAQKANLYPNVDSEQGELWTLQKHFQTVHFLRNTVLSQV